MAQDEEGGGGVGGHYVEQVITLNLSFLKVASQASCVCLHVTKFIKLSIVIFCSCSFHFLFTVQLAQLIPSVSLIIVHVCTCANVNM